MLELADKILKVIVTMLHVLKKLTHMKHLEMKTKIYKMKNILNGIHNKLDITEGKIMLWRCNNKNYWKLNTRRKNNPIKLKEQLWSVGLLQVT